MRQSIEQLMTNDTPKVIVATSTLGQGVNIGISTVIISNTLLDRTRRVKVNDFWNIVGRAGRAFTDTEGKILYVIDKNKWLTPQIDMKNFYFDQINIEKAKSGIYKLLEFLFFESKNFGIDFEMFLELLAENIDLDKASDGIIEFTSIAEGIFDQIDDTLISMNMSNKSHLLENTSSWIDDVFRSSLAVIQASNREFSGNKVIEVLKARNQGLLKVVGGSENWKTIAISSVPVRASLEIDKRINEIVVYINEYRFSDLESSDFMRFIELLDYYVMSLPMAKKI